MGSAVIAVVDYGMGNLRSVFKALERVGARVELASDGAALERAEKVVLPGVGAFGHARRELDARALADVLAARAREAAGGGRPFLGICLGMQLLFERSAESPGVEGLAVWPGRCVRFDVGGLRRAGLKVPHMGWSPVAPGPAAAGSVYGHVAGGTYFYFVHSYCVEPADASLVALEAGHGRPFAAACARGRLFGSQFHPEKSQAEGLAVLRAFVGL